MAARSKTLGSVIKRKREELGLTVRGLAEAIDVAPSTILRFEDGSRRPTPDVVKHLAKSLGLEVEQLLALANHKLPTFAPYLRAKYDLPDEAVAELEKHFETVSQQHKGRKRGRS